DFARCLRNPTAMRTMMKSLRQVRFAVVGAALLALLACGTNPVTGKRELQFVSKNEEISIGQQNYAPMRQSEGGDYAVLPDLTAYINEVGQKLVAVSDRVTLGERRLPFEF